MSTDRIEQSSPADEMQRRGHMAALSVAERIVSISPIVPTNVRAYCAHFAPGEPSVDVYFHRCAEGVEELAKALDGKVTTRPNSESDMRLFVVAELSLAGVPIQAWSLVDNQGASAEEAL
ncbi:hypothetical protein [Streptomyces abikoensis]|uniref:hypothetical protein n=1 Tax=Streptomyces abikoensis TaxID=97398 RepID=UPI001679934F|nr:hypothetical protein [Streptomyces abikoensis]GGP55515.1 hypothetical protein GCM10010214_30880 [Streptomyces abikoensis]